MLLLQWPFIERDIAAFFDEIWPCLVKIGLLLSLIFSKGHRLTQIIDFPPTKHHTHFFAPVQEIVNERISKRVGDFERQKVRTGV